MNDDYQYDNNTKFSNAIGGDAKRWRNASAKEQGKFFESVGEPGNAVEVVTKKEGNNSFESGAISKYERTGSSTSSLMVQ